MPRNHNLGTSTLRNRNRVTNKTRLRIIQGNIEADPLVLDEDEEKARIVSTAGVDAEDANEHHLQAVLSAAQHRHPSVSRTTRADSKPSAPAPSAFIPVPDSTGVVDNYAELYTPNKWRDPAPYVRSSETVDEACSNALIDGFTYIMDERDKEWLDRNNEEARGEGTSTQGALSTPGTTTRVSQRSAKAKGKEPESTQPVTISEDELELVMGIFEKTTHDKTEFLHHSLETGMAFPAFTDYQDVFSSPLSPSLFATFTVPSWIPTSSSLLRIAKSVYPHWRERRMDRGGHRIIPPLNFDEADVLNESYICFRRREIKAVRKTRASQATSSDKLLRMQAEFVQSNDIAQLTLTRENMKRDNLQESLKVWEKRIEFMDFKRKFPMLGTKEDEELLQDKEKVKRSRPEAASRIPGVKLRTGESTSPSVAPEPPLRPKERLAIINGAVDRDMARHKERDMHWEDVTANPYQRPGVPSYRRLWKAIPAAAHSSLSTTTSNDDEDEDESNRHVRFLRLRYGRGGQALLDRRDAYLSRPGLRSGDDVFERRRKAFARRLAMTGTSDEEDEETATRLRERWRFDQDDVPPVGPDGPEEQDRMLVDDYEPRYLRHSMGLLSDQDQQHLSSDPTITISVDGRQQSFQPYRPTSYALRRDQVYPQRAFQQQQGAMRQIPAGMPLSSIPGGVPISMQAQFKPLHNQNGLAQMRISTSGRHSAAGAASPGNLVPPTQSSPPRPSSAVSTSAPAVSDIDKLNQANGAQTNGVASTSVSQMNGDAQGTAQVDGTVMSQQASPPNRPKVDGPQSTAAINVPNGYHVAMNGYTNLSNAQYMRQAPAQLTMQQMQNLKLAFAQSQDMHNSPGRQINAAYIPNPNGTHFNVQLNSGAQNMNLKIPQGRQWASMQQPVTVPSNGDQSMTHASMSPSPHLGHAVPNVPVRAPSANGRRPSIGVPYQHSPHMPHSSPSPLPAQMQLPAHQSPPRPSMTPTMKMASPQLQHQHAVSSVQGGY
ncbi:hypothetical protein CONPUDRAFT_59856 [Coniophora puteana RWD-64-598 SS2]|uniref:Enhancer of polycomb-like protein n=1 Tax=Coniophora puteana (strain RWD-64-598) TaxID=741705 RepID=A0A5M3MJ33_CONPW|nr:uncharacterized protein CONPUDRAFT_59856 [Coniophora puteana RWD-64-598 SS2]EIW79222.1 hypothetical protein CONPUDRAFT_59856 [Coniophora puteana RWD-64-598 SS2]